MSMCSAYTHCPIKKEWRGLEFGGVDSTPSWGVTVTWTMTSFEWCQKQEQRVLGQKMPLCCCSTHSQAVLNVIWEQSESNIPKNYVWKFISQFLLVRSKYQEIQPQSKCYEQSGSDSAPAVSESQATESVPDSRNLGRQMWQGSFPVLPDSDSRSQTGGRTQREPCVLGSWVGEDSARRVLGIPDTAGSGGRGQGNDSTWICYHRALFTDYTDTNVLWLDEPAWLLKLDFLTNKHFNNMVPVNKGFWQICWDLGTTIEGS